ncbi:MAG: OFA family MFS transporter [Kiritimatiellia bacterium]|jgi:OFA family oxalate/formate antiporter-like MFS transporter|nr:OFA family MFS transporter [Kiritimatiellia bacterium]
MENSKEMLKNGWRVALAGMGINLALGILYTWSVISKGIPDSWNWSESDKSLPYAVACLVFCLIMVPAGRLQDKFSPRPVATVGGILVGLGMILCSRFTSLTGFILGFGILAGAGFGFGYASATPPAVKWFPPAKTGQIAGIVVSGFGLASVYAAPLAKWLTAQYGLQMMMIILGIAFLVVVVGLAQLLRAPHKARQFISGSGPVGTMKAQSVDSPEKKIDYSPREILRERSFYLLWFMYACGAGAGLMVIAKLAVIAKVQMGLSVGFLLVAALAVGNGGGRVVAGMLSDKIGRKRTMFTCFIFQAVLVFLLSRIYAGGALATLPVMSVISALIGANYGANLSLFPSITKDYYGLKNFGVNYGLVFTSWGVGGFMLALVAGKIYDATKSFNVAFYGAATLLIMAAVVTFFLRPPQLAGNEAV